MGKFKPGESGNKGGRPKGRSVKTVLYSSMRKALTQPKKGGTIPLGQELTEKIIQRAVNEPTSYEAKAMVDYILKTATPDEVDGRLDRFMTRNVDFLEYRIYKQLTDIQQVIFASNNPEIAMMAGRRAGKTEEFKARAKRRAARGERYLYIGLTAQRAIDLMYDDVLKGVTDLGLTVEVKSRTTGEIKLTNGAELYFKGNHTTDEREKHRGGKWHEINVDECQSQKALAYLLEDICGPMLMDYKGTLVLGGTGPRVRGTYWEVLWTKTSAAGKYNWNLTKNPHIPDAEKALAEIREKKGLKETDPLYVREYLGQIAYDDDALVFRLTDSNLYQQKTFTEWLSRQTVTDVHFVGGLDYGWTDADAFAILCFAEGSRETWLIDTYKKRREGTRELATAIKTMLEALKAKYPNYMHHEVMIYGDSSGPKISNDLSTEYGLPIMPAYRAGRDMAIEILRDDIRAGAFKTPGGTDFDDECLKTVYARDEADNLTHEIDDETYHPDVIPAVLYACRDIWLQQGREHR